MREGFSLWRQRPPRLPPAVSLGSPPARPCRSSLAPARSPRPITAPEGQGATFVELFFDLVFVFAVTEVTGLTASGLSAGGAAQAALVFWLIWWAWTQFTWALNPADTDHPAVRLGTLVATGLAFLMAVAVGDAFGDGGLLFVVPYIAVRLVGLGLYLWVSWGDERQRRAVRVFGAVSLLGLGAALAGGLVDGPARAWLWGGTVALDVTAAMIGGRRDGWSLFPEHFAERHALFVIIALGESLVAAGVAATAHLGASGLFPVVLGAVVVSCLLWWSYFGWLKAALEGAMIARTGVAQSMLGRDVYSLIHFPLIAGVIGIAVGVEEMVAHPAEPLHAETLAGFAAGLVLFIGSAAAAWKRASGEVLWGRIAALGAMVVALVLAAHAAPIWILTAAAAGLLAINGMESRRCGGSADLR